MKKYILFAILTVFSTACETALEENPKNFLNPDQFFNSDGEAIQAVNGAYNTCYFLYGSGTTYDLGYWSALGTDIGIPNTGDQAGFNYMTYTLGPNDETNLASIWQTLYKGVANCNMVIAGVKDNEKLSPEVSRQVMGQALFLRSLYYYWLTCFWGDVPMWLDALDVDKISGQLPRTPVDEIRRQIVSDLTAAAADLPAQWTGNEQGRVSKWAALMLLTRVHLWQKDWANAASVAQQVITNEGGEHRLLADYGDLWGIKNEYNDENIWEIDFTLNTHSQAFTDRYVPNQNFDVVVPGYEGMFTGYALITSTPEFLATFEPGDLRKQWYDFNGAGGVTTKFHYIRKHIEWGEPRGNHGLNCTVFRMADAHLMYAEAQNELSGPTAEAYTSLNALRTRAGLASLSGLSKDAFREAVRNERLHELSFEYGRRWDLIRWGTLVEAVQKTAKSNPSGAKNIRPHHVLCPIPSIELSMNPALTQNPGY
ncbi:MAG: RagB/SusD family nutrient uptake outer membrane protein [Dyadobacter fermentans]